MMEGSDAELSLKLISNICIDSINDIQQGLPNDERHHAQLDEAKIGLIRWGRDICMDSNPRFIIDEPRDEPCLQAKIIAFSTPERGSKLTSTYGTDTRGSGERVELMIRLVKDLEHIRLFLMGATPQSPFPNVAREGATAIESKANSASLPRWLFHGPRKFGTWMDESERDSFPLLVLAGPMSGLKSREAAAGYIAGLLVQDTELFDLCHQASIVLDRVQFGIQNEDLLRTFHRGLCAPKPESSGVSVIYVLGFQDLRWAISWDMYEIVITSYAPINEETELRRYESIDEAQTHRPDKSYTVNFVPGGVQSTTSTTLGPNVRTAYLDDWNRRYGGDTPSVRVLARTPMSITSSEPFENYKESWRKFLLDLSNKFADSADRDSLTYSLSPSSPIPARTLGSKALSYLERLGQPAVRSGFERIYWQSALGKLIYIDIKPSHQDGVKILQELLRKASQKHLQAASHGNESSRSSRAVQQPEAAHLRNVSSSNIAGYDSSPS
ncbi:hypothetical protein O1611_g8481 [Lasiodiplodia mahajangana]|uniref:Uncharacterized protein n=1 Tax=Lasiodiplodia mahajangana TaxID=1108764 RepID=A0ACC2JCG7_9PEZI|nr:hypothetical protein O1611_g8481 [Lasiodiplodia mahajangana]